MIKIFAKEYSQAVAFLCKKLEQEVTEYDLFLSKSKQSASQFLNSAIGSMALIMVGNVGDNSALFSDTFGLAMFYDSFAERNVKEYCKLAGVSLPPQHTMDKLCVAPESFNHYASAYGCQCTCYGEYKKTHVYIIADDQRECEVAYDNYLYQDLFKNSASSTQFTFKVFGLSNKAVNERLSKLGKYVSRKCETTNLDSKIILSFPPKSSKSIIAETLEHFKQLFGDFVYANADQSLAKTVVDTLHQLGKTVSVAESITGGMVTSSIVDVAGASSVLYEGVVTYSIPSKCRRLDLNPHFVDEHGAVSQQVAKEMAVGLRKNGSDVAVSTTGFAGPTAENNLPVGLCYIAVATEKSVTVYRNLFGGDRNNIRAQAANMALYLVYKTLTK
ncbi:MAG: nicotinamide-nucleotide amidohydrolase family protein [Clostridiales bacterium]|nr:nicotinamide-nucleotide amidohydrolase family protein [Clostridiales bacterium]